MLYLNYKHCIYTFKISYLFVIYTHSLDIKNDNIKNCAFKEVNIFTKSKDNNDYLMKRWIKPLISIDTYRYLHLQKMTSHLISFISLALSSNIIELFDNFLAFYKWRQCYRVSLQIWCILSLSLFSKLQDYSIKTTRLCRNYPANCKLFQCYGELSLIRNIPFLSLFSIFQGYSLMATMLEDHFNRYKQLQCCWVHLLIQCIPCLSLSRISRGSSNKTTKLYNYYLADHISFQCY